MTYRFNDLAIAFVFFVHRSREILGGPGRVFRRTLVVRRRFRSDLHVLHQKCQLLLLARLSLCISLLGEAFELWTVVVEVFLTRFLYCRQESSMPSPVTDDTPTAYHDSRLNRVVSIYIAQPILQRARRLTLRFL